MAIKEIPINYKVYYKLMRDRASKKISELKDYITTNTDKLKEDHNKILNNKDLIKSICKVDITNYDEFTNNEYSTGTFLKVAKGLFTNRSNNYELVSDLFDLYSFAINQRKLYEAKHNLSIQEKLYNTSLKDYNKILKDFYTEVHKRLILNGEGYTFEQGLGWICINRCILRHSKKVLDYAATKKREKELKAAGKRIYNKEEEAWCKRNGIEYKAEDKRVFRKDEYCYEVPLIDSKIKDGRKLKLTLGDYRHTSIRGKTNDELLKQCNNNTENICELPIDLRTKITLCDKADKILYTKFIRNENQESITYGKTNR